MNNVVIRDCHEADFTESISQFREAISLNPDDEWAHYQLGETLDNRDAKFAECSEALRLNPNYPHAHFALGQTLGSKGDLDGAIIEARSAIRLDPKVALFHEGLAQWLEKKGDPEQALKEYREAAKLFPLGYERTYEAFVQKVTATRQQEKLQHWLGTWVFMGPVKVSSGCGGKRFPIPDTDEPDDTFKILSVSPTGEVTAEVEHPMRADDIPKRLNGSDWAGTAIETNLVLTMNPILPGAVLFGTGDKLESAEGRLEARREVDRYSVDFFYTHTWNSPNGSRCSDFFENKAFLGQIRRP